MDGRVLQGLQPIQEASENVARQVLILQEAIVEETRLVAGPLRLVSIKRDTSTAQALVFKIEVQMVR